MKRLKNFFEQNKGKYYMISKFGKKNFTDMDYSNTDETHYFVFGRETKGLPDWLKEEYQESLMRIPMTDKVRSSEFIEYRRYTGI
jgi:Predicted rRNA methylase (SpoU class)